MAESTSPEVSSPLLLVDRLSVGIHSDVDAMDLVRDVSFEVREASITCLVGESGAGKTLTSHAIARLLDQDTYEITGSVLFKGSDILTLSRSAFRRYRGPRIGMVFQDPMSRLNPVVKIGHQMVDTLRVHQRLSRRRARDIAVESLASVHISDPRKRLHQYPHELSGGMLQRIMIAMALSLDPDLLLADEPTTGLDVTLQAEILSLLRDIADQRGLGVLMVTHDLSLVRDVADEVVVMYGGVVAENASTEDLFERPFHPYTQALIDSIPPLKRVAVLPTIQGAVTKLGRISGCPFAPRCDNATSKCEEMPPRAEHAPQHVARCWHPVRESSAAAS